MICPDCKKAINDQAKYCGYCGHDFSSPKAAASPPPRPPNEYNKQMSIFTVIALCGICLLFYVLASNFRLDTKQPPQPTPNEEPTLVPSTSTPSGMATETIRPTTTIQPMPNPLVFIDEYYGLINARRYESAWVFLSAGFLDRKSTATGKPFQFTDYAEYWNTVSSLDILEASVESSGPEAATVLAKFRYNMVNGSSNYYQHRFYLMINPSQNSWLIDNVDSWK